MKILLPVDGSDLSLEAVRFAVGLVRQGLGATMVLANVQEPATLYEMVVAADTELIARASAAAGAHTLESAEALLKAANVDYECEVAAGDPAHTIVDILERFECDLVIMGARGKSSLRSALLGSVSNEVLHAAGVPVMIVKASEEQEGDDSDSSDAGDQDAE
jgi:nucleotide-binding universal stress UspA family protein